MKLYKVTLQGMTTNAIGPIYGISYVVAEDTDKAYTLVRAHLDQHDLGFRTSRELASVELIAEDVMYPDCRTMLFIQKP